MRVDELIAKLQEFPADREVILAPVYCEHDEEEYDGDSVTEVSTEPDTVNGRGLAVMIS